MKAVWYGITGVMVAFTAFIAWYSYDRMQSSQTAPAASEAAVKSKVKTLLPEQKTVRLAPPKSEPAAKPEDKPQETPAPSVKPDTSAKTPLPEAKIPLPKAKTPDVVSPTFDVVRVEPDGSAVIAGRAPAGWKVVVQSNGRIIGEAIANSRGEWVIISDQPVSPGTSNLKLTASSPDSTITTASSQIVAISRPEATLKAPGIMAAAEIPKPKPQVQEDEPAPAKTKPEPKAKADAPSKTLAAATPKPAMQEPSEASVPVKAEPKTPVAEAPIDTGSKMAAAATPKPAMQEPPKASVPVPAEPETPVAEAAADTASRIAAAAMPKPAMQKPPKASVPVPAEPKTPVAEAPIDTAPKTVAAAMPKPAMQEPPKASVPVPAEPETPVAEGLEKKPGKPAEPLIIVSEPGKASRVLQAPVEERAEESIPLTFRSVDYNDKGQVILSGKAKKGSSLRVYLNNDFIGSTRADYEGIWVLKTKKDVSPGKYTLRIDQIGRGNKIAARVEAPFERAAPEAVKQARINGEVIIQPGDNLWNISRAFYGEGIQYTIIYEANKNKIRDPDFIYPGQIFSTPNSDPAAGQKEREALRQKMLRRR